VFERWGSYCARFTSDWWLWPAIFCLVVETNLGVARLVGSLPGALDVFQILSADSTRMLLLKVRLVPPGRRFAAKEWRIPVSGRFASLVGGHAEVVRRLRLAVAEFGCTS